MDLNQRDIIFSIALIDNHALDTALLNRQNLTDSVSPAHVIASPSNFIFIYLVTGDEQTTTLDIERIRIHDCLDQFLKSVGEVHDEDAEMTQPMC